MAEITAALVKQLREGTGAGMMDCKNALGETGGDLEKATQLLRERGLGKAEKKAGRLAAEGLIGLRVSEDLAQATLSEVNSETDFVAKNENFIKLVKDATTHIHEGEIATAQALALSQIGGVNFEEYLKGQIATIGENLVVRRFASLRAGPNGLVQGYLHSNGRVGVIIAAAAENAKVASRAGDFLKQLCMHIAAMRPRFLSYENLDPAFVESEYKALVAELEKENEERRRLKKPELKIPKYASRAQLTPQIIQAAQEEIKAELRSQNKPEKIWDKILPGKLNSFIADNSQLDSQLTLLGQFYVLDDKKTVGQVIEERAAELGGWLRVVEFIRFEVGEGLEKRSEDFAAEVAAQL